nr:hypothetical protein [uncultured Tyzzerella sp.]
MNVFIDIKSYVEDINNKQEEYIFIPKFRMEKGKISTDNDYTEIAEYLIRKYRLRVQPFEGYRIVTYDGVILTKKDLDFILITEIYNSRVNFRSEIKCYIKTLAKDI